MIPHGITRRKRCLVIKLTEQYIVKWLTNLEDRLRLLEEITNPPGMTKRKIIKHGNSLAITLPSEIVKINDLKLGDTIKVPILLIKKVEE